MVIKMPAQKDFRQAELELAQSLTDSDHRKGLVRSEPDCPSTKELRQFVTGKSRQPDVVLAHLGSCMHCFQLLSSLRIRAVRTKRITLALAVSAAALLIAGGLLLLPPSEFPKGIATIDLRFAAPTRGVENSTSVTARRTNGTLRVLLPVGSEGTYECQIQTDPEGRALASGFGQGVIETPNVVLALPMNLAHLSSGRYRLALRRSGSEWVYYPLALK
jgi:hypothetical protein